MFPLGCIIFQFKNNDYFIMKFTRQVHDLDVLTSTTMLKVRNHIF